MTDKEVMQQALDALKNPSGNCKFTNAEYVARLAAITALKNAITQPVPPVQPKDVDWQSVGKLIEANDRAKSLGFMPGTSNWGAMLWKAVQRTVQPAPLAEFSKIVEILADEESRQWMEGYVSGLTEISQIKAERDAILSLVAAIAQSAKEIAWTDNSAEFPVHHSMSLAHATNILKRLYQEWPGGLDEIGSAFRTKAGNNMTKEVKLLCCPFCGAPALDDNPDGDMEGYKITCGGNHMLFGATNKHCPINTFSYANYIDAVTAWNTRNCPQSQ